MVGGYFQLTIAGFEHSAFIFSHESMIDQVKVEDDQVKPGALKKWVCAMLICLRSEPDTMAVEEIDSKEIPQSKIQALEGHTKSVFL